MAGIPTVQQTNTTIAEFIIFNFYDMPIFSFLIMCNKQLQIENLSQDYEQSVLCQVNRS